MFLDSEMCMEDASCHLTMLPDELVDDNTDSETSDIEFNDEEA